MTKKIVIIGPESTGKSTLCAQLADHYKTAWVKEYAREYLQTNGTNYSFNNLLDIAKGQMVQEEQVLSEIAAGEETDPSAVIKNQKLVFIDTNMYVIKVWSEYVFNDCHHWVLNQIVDKQYDLYLLCDIDLPWIKDNLREYPDLKTREKLYHYYKDIMVNQNIPWVNVDGNYGER